MGSATVPVAAVGVSPTVFGTAAGSPIGYRCPEVKVFGGTPKTAGETPALSELNCIDWALAGKVFDLANWRVFSVH